MEEMERISDEHEVMTTARVREYIMKSPVWPASWLDMYTGTYPDNVNLVQYINIEYWIFIKIHLLFKFIKIQTKFLLFKFGKIHQYLEIIVLDLLKFFNISIV